MGLEGASCENEKWLELAQDHVQWHCKASSKIRNRRAQVYVNSILIFFIEIVVFGNYFRAFYNLFRVK